jgi:hypothetical protein
MDSENMQMPPETEESKPSRFRWMPVVVPACATLVCLGLLASQQTQIRELDNRRKAVNADLANATPVSSSSSDTPLQAQDAPSPATYESEITRLKALTVTLNAEVSALKQARMNQTSTPALPPGQDFLTAQELAPMLEMRTRAMRIACANQLKQFGLAVHLWAVDNEDLTPRTVLSMSNYLSTPKILVCPADTTRQAAPDWNTFTTANCSYTYLAPSAQLNEPQRVLAHCTFHNNVCLFDGSVQMVQPDRLVQLNGTLYLKPPDEQAQALSPGPGGTPATTPQAPDAEARERFMRRYGLKPQ